MAMEITRSDNTADSENGKTIHLSDNLNEYVDIISFNSYMGWYWGNTSGEWMNANWHIPYNKPVIVSEFGGSAPAGKHGDKSERWTEEFQAELYRCNLALFDRIDGLAGLSPWILVDFLSPRRQNFGLQDFFNRKGLVSSWGEKKQAFFVMQQYYRKKEAQFP
jgi:beta-glucuronidase